MSDAKFVVINPDAPYESLPSDSAFTKPVLQRVEYYAKALSQDEVMEMFGIPSLDVLCEFDQRIFVYACNVSKRKGAQEAVTQLFEQMKNTKNSKGVEAALHYLVNNSDHWEKTSGSGEHKAVLELQLNPST